MGKILCYSCLFDAHTEENLTAKENTEKRVTVIMMLIEIIIDAFSLPLFFFWLSSLFSERRLF